MAYSPKNGIVFAAAFAGALAGIGGGEKNPTDPSATGIGPVAVSGVAGAFAQSFDTAWGTAPIDSFQQQTINSICEAVMAGRTPRSLNPGDYLSTCNAIIALVKSGENYYAAQGITPPALDPTGGGLTPPSNGSWSVGLWVFDPQNVSLVASDSNPGTLALPLLNFAEVIRRFGTTSPELGQATEFRWISSHTNNTDPVIFTPYHVNGGYSFFTTVPTVVATGVILAGTTPRNTAAGTNSLLITNLGALATLDCLIVNTTAGKASIAPLYKSLGGNSFDVHQPLTASAVLNAPNSSTQVNTWADGDTVNILKPQQVNIVWYDPTVIDSNAGFTNNGYLYQTTFFQPPGGLAAGAAQLGPYVRMIECVIQRRSAAIGSSSASAGPFSTCLAASNCAFRNRIDGESPVYFFGGGVASAGPCNLNIVTLAGGFILGSTMTVRGAGSTLLNEVYFDKPLNMFGSSSCAAGAVCYGPDRPFPNGSSRFNIDPTATWVGTCTGTAMLATGIALNGTPTGHSLVSGAPDVTTGGVTTTPANIDAAGGLLFNYGGASLAKSA